MTPRITIGSGISGAIRYAMGEGRDPVTREVKKLAPGAQSRVQWFGGTGFFWPVQTAADIEQARREMEFDALNQRGKIRLDTVHLMLAWRPGENPDRAHMEAQVKSALAAIGMANAKALYFVHADEDYSHIHIVASKINPETGRAYDLKGNYLQLSTWAQQYEAEHGGIISLNRATNNELRAAIAARDAGAVIEALTRQRATFTPAQLESALAKQLKDAGARAQFSAQILARPEIVQLAEIPDGPIVRYSTRAVIEAELHVLRAAAGLAADLTHGIDETRRAAVLISERFAKITDEQMRAFHHATERAGLALIDGQAGTGKSYTIAAVRTAYEAAGCTVIGLGPTNAVAQDMAADGFGRAATVHSELFALNSGRRQWDAKTVVIVDEAAMLDTKLMALVTAHAHEAGAKLILVGDDRQLSSIDRGGMFGALKDRYGAAALTEVKRQHKLDDRRASEWMAEGNFSDSLNVYDRMGAIHWTRTQGEARAALIAQWAKDSAAQPDKTRFVFAYTNDDVATLNAGLRAVRRQRGELGPDTMLETAHGRHNFASGDRILFTGTDKKRGITNGRAGTVAGIDGSHVTVTLDGHGGPTITFDSASFRQFRHGYAGTIYKAQGRTLDQTYLYHSEHWRRAASYVALTRHRDKAELFVATNTARDVNQLARQMARTDDRRAASQFHYAPEITAAPLTAAELHARFAAAAIPPKDQTPKDPIMQPKDGTAQAANENAREQLDELAAQQAASVRPAEPESGRYDNLKLAADFRQAEHEATDADAGRISAAWKQPAFTHDTIRFDPWTAVYLPIPPDAGRSMFGRELLRDARAVARDLQMATDGLENPPGGWLEKWAAGPAINRDSTREENWAAARGRVAEIEARLAPRLETFDEMDERHRDEWELVHGAYGVEELPSQLALRHAEERARLAWQQQAFSFETIHADPWTAVYLPIPDNADAALLVQARTWVSDLRQYADPARFEGTRSVSALAQPLIDPESYPVERNFAAATARLAELDARLEIAAEARQMPEAAAAALAPDATAAAAGGPQPAATTHVEIIPPPAFAEARSDIRPARGARYFLDRLGEGLAAAVQFFADMVSPPPKLTEGQIHDRLQAVGNLETLHTAAVAAAQQVHEAETDERIFRADQQQQQANLGFAERYGLPPTSEAVLGREHGPEPEEEPEP